VAVAPVMAKPVMSHGEGLGDHLRFVWFKRCLDPFLEEILNMKRKFFNCGCSSHYGQTGDEPWGGIG